MAGSCHDGTKANSEKAARRHRWGRCRNLSEGVHMATKIIVSYDGTANEDDAIALGGLFARAGAEIALAYVRHTHEPDRERETLAQAEAQELLARGTELLGNADVATHVVTDRSTPEGLAAL